MNWAGDGLGSKPAYLFGARMSPFAGCGHGPREAPMLGRTLRLGAGFGGLASIRVSSATLPLLVAGPGLSTAFL
jgi:hypothetical protein